VEGLETRKLFSVMPMTIYAHARPAENAVHVQAAVVAKPATTAVPTFADGLWTGRYTVKAWPFKTKYDLDLEFTTVAKTYAIGRVTIDGDDYSGRWTGVVGPKGGFTYTLRRNGKKITLDGHLNLKSTSASGKLTVDWGWRYSRGDYTLTKLA